MKRLFGKLNNFFRKPFVYAAIFSLILTGCVGYSLLDVFVIPSYQTAVTYAKTNSYLVTGDTEETETEEDETTEETEAETIITDSTYSDENITITITTKVVNDTTVYICDIYCSIQYLQTALANSTYGTNVTEKTSEIADSVGAILAINGDFYGANKKGYVIKNGVLYRDTVRSDSEYGDLVIYSDGSWDIIYEDEISAEELMEDGVVQLFAFGPTLVYDGEIVVSGDDEVDRSMTNNPRTAIGIVEDGHYVFVVSDGRTDESEGLSLYELAQVLEDCGCTLAYNLDGGGSSTLVFMGEVINNPTTSGNSIKEREVSDIVYIGY